MASNKHRINRESCRKILLAGVTLMLAGAIALVCHILVITNPYREWTEPKPGKLTGGGTQSDPYLISSLEDLYLLRTRVEYGNNFAGAYFVQTQDIDMSACEDWTPIGEYGSDKYFSGTYDGLGHVLKNLNISGRGRNALFGMLCGTVQNLGIESGSIEGSYAGSIASIGAKTAEIRNCYNKADIHGKRRAGGIADDFEGKISYCWNFGEITSETGTAGGICCLGSQVYRCSSSELPVVPNVFFGMGDSVVFDSVEELGAPEEPDGELSPRVIVDGETVRFGAEGRAYVPGTRRSRDGFFGRGTEKDPYLITGLEDLCKLRGLVNTGNTFAGTYFAQTQDIDMSAIGNWTPIGLYGTEALFYGTYDGNGHTLSNLSITGTDNNGLFGMLCGTVKNLGIESGHIEGAFVGAIASHGREDAAIVNCYNKATVHGTGRAGGIADNLGEGSISRCWNLGEVRSDTGVAGGISSYSARIDHCCSQGMPLMPPELFGVVGSHTFDDAGSIDAWLNEIYAGVNAAQTPLMYREGESVRFDPQPYKPWMEGEYGFSGMGLEGDPYLITDLEDLSELRDLVNEGNDFAGAYFLQTRNIDMSACENWTPIGIFGSEKYFYGIYDGNGHALSNLTIVSTENASLFGVLCGTVQNLGIESGYIEGANIGAITSHGGGACRIVNCYNKAAVHGIGRAGGIADNFGGVISHCWNFGEVTCDAGVVGGISSYSAQIDHCYSYGLPLTPSEFSGGLTDSETFDDAGKIDAFLTRERLCMYAAAAQEAQEPSIVWDGETLRFAGHVYKTPLRLHESGFYGSGTEDDPFLITSLDDLSRFRDLVNGGEEFGDTYFLQTQDIDMAPCESWTPIGMFGTDHYFYGVYDGNGYTLSNLKVYTEDAGGLFGMLCGTVKNLGIESGLIESGCAGAITSHGSGQCVIDNCYNKAAVHGFGRAGGIVDNFAARPVSNCWNLGEVTCDTGTAGGICSYSAQIDHCYSYGMLLVPGAFLEAVSDSRIVYTEKSLGGLADRLAEKAYVGTSMEDGVPLLVSHEGGVIFDGDCHMAPETLTGRFAGSGTEDDPYLIAGLDDLVEFRDLVNNGHNFIDVYFLQTQDIDMSACTNWTPIGLYNSGAYFFGNYDGGGHTLKNLRIIRSGNAGLFGYLSGTVRNLGIESGYIEADFVGAFTSHGGDGALIYNCYNKAAVFGTGRAAGIVDNFGGIADIGQVTYCWNLGQIKANGGTLAGISSYSARIKNSYSWRAPVASKLENFYDLIEDSATFDSTDEMDELLSEEYAAMYAEGLDVGKVPFVVRDGDTIRFDSGFVPPCYGTKTIADYGFMLLLAAAALAAVGFAALYVSGKKTPPRAQDGDQMRGGTGGGTFKKDVKGTALFLALLCVGGLVAEDTLYLKTDNGTLPVKHYIQQNDGAVDVLFLGSSKVGINLSCDTLWREQGVSSFAMWGHTQPIWNSYYYLKEALKHGRPKVIVLDVTTTVYSVIYRNDAIQYANTKGLEMSKDKLEEIQVSSPQENWMDLLLGFPLYHARYSDLAEMDFAWYPWSKQDAVDKGSILLHSYGMLTSDLDVGDIDEVARIPEKCEKYLIKILEQCKEENIPLVLMASDATTRADTQPYFNAIAEIAEAWDVPFLNFNLLDEETGVTPEDFSLDNIHVNTNGSRKISSYLGNYLKEHYNLKDHRGDPYYSTWDEFALRQENAHFIEISKVGDYLKEMLRDDREAVLIRWTAKDDDPTLLAFEQTAEQAEFDASFLQETGDRCWVFRHTPDMTEYESIALDKAVDILLGEETLTIDPYSERAVRFDGEKLCDTQAGLMCVIYDADTGIIVDKCMLAEPSGAAGMVRHM